MAGKRHLEIPDNTMYNKMSRMDTALQHSMPYAGKTIPKDLQVCKNFLTYPLSGTEGQHSFNPWSSSTAYLQYAGNALNQHLQSGGVSKCQRPETERINNPFQFSDNSSSHFSAHQHPVHNYHMSPSRAYPQFAVPRPVYRGPSSFTDPAYQARDFQSMDVHVGSQIHCPPAMEWSSSTRFPYSSSPLYVSGMKNPPPVHNGYLDATGSPSSLPRSMQELGPIHRPRSDINTSVGSSPSRYQGDTFTDHLHPFAQQNMQLLCAEGSVSVGKPKNSAFAASTHDHYKCIPYQANPDTRMGHIYSKAYYDSTMDNFHQRSALYSCNGDKSVSPLSTKGPPTYGKAQKLHSGYVNSDPRMITQVDDRTQTSQTRADIELQIGSAPKTSREPQMCLGQREKTSLFGSDSSNRDFCVNSANMDKKHIFSPTRMSSNLNDRSLYEKCIKEQSSHISFLEQNSSSKILPAISTKGMFANEPVRESSLTSKLSSSPGSFHTLDDRRKSYETFDKHTVKSHSKAAVTAHTNSTMLNSSFSSGSISRHQMSDDNRTSSYEAQAIQSQGCALPQASKVATDGPKSPPMPVINDVFSLAPYRAYLEGNAPHPFPAHQESEVENNISTSIFSQPSSPSEKAGEVEKDAFNLKSIPAEVNTEYHDTEKTHQQVNAQTGESQDTNSSNNSMDEEVLDLSLKRVTQTSSPKQDQVNISHSSHIPSPKLVTEKNVSQLSEDLSIKGQESCLSQGTRIMPNTEKELDMSYTNVKTTSHNMENFPSFSTEKTPCLAQESYTTAKTYFCQSRDSCTFQAPDTQTQEHQRSSGASETTQSMAQESLAKHHLHANKNLYPLQKSYPYQAIKSQPSFFNEKCKSRLTPNLSQKYEGWHTSQALQNFTPEARNVCPSRTPECKPDQLIENYQSHATKHLSLPAAETKSHNLQENDTSQTPGTFQLQQNCSSGTTEIIPHHSYYKCISEPVNSSTQSANLSIFVNTIQTPTTFLPQAIIYSSPSAIFCNKNVLLPSQKHQNLSTERRTRKSVNSSRSETSLSGSENEGTGFQSSKAFMIRKYKLMKFSNSEPEVQEANCNSSSHALLRPFLLTTDAAQSLPPSAPESSPTLGEANVSLAGADELAPNGSRQQFSELHHSVRAAITSSVARSPSSLLEDWLEKSKAADKHKTPAKTKSGSRPNDPSPESPCRDIWEEFDGVRLRLHKLLSQLETFMFTRSCPFPHVIRAGAIFIPIYLVKEVLYPELGTSVDRVLQKHKVELRPTTLSEEKLLRETKLKDCPSRMLKLLALKQLPDVYPDLLHLFCEHTIQTHLGSCTQSGLHTHK
ncbi:uncharacterized protein C15orf39 homolog isoform 2-T2 [Mantella aurantiaca]